MIRMFWFCGNQNFGDILSPFLVEAMSGRAVTYSDNFNACDLLAIGSILQRINTGDFSGAIWGSGLIGPCAQPPPWTRTADICAVRGRLTRELLGLGASTPLGDPGLLADRWATRRPRRYKLGIIPHFVDTQDPAVQAWASRPHVKIIDIMAGVQAVLDQVSECEAIVSSSLHGLIIADALHLPSAWTQLSDQVIGGTFKFRDYYSSLDIDPQPVKLDPAADLDALLAQVRPCRAERVEHLKRGLIESFPFRRERRWPRWRRLRRLLQRR